MKSLPPRDFDELKKLVEDEDIEVWLEEYLSDSKTRYFILDRRRTFEEGELYEIIL